MLFLTLIMLCSVLYWAWSGYALSRTVASLTRLERVVIAPRESWPRVSLVIPACNEGEELRSCVASRLQDGYPNLECILINDRSTDHTGDIMDEFARTDPRVRVIHIHDLPEGWLGKVHALHIGSQIATGDWLLFSDADVSFEPETLMRVITFAETDKLDHLGTVATLTPRDYLLNAAVTAMMRIMLTMGQFWKLGDPKSRASTGAGYFNLVRRSAFDRTHGFQAMRLEVVDDITLGQMLKLSGARVGVVDAHRFLKLPYYHSFREMVVGMDKNGFAALGRFNLALLTGLTVSLLVLELGALLALVPGISMALKILTLFVMVTAITIIGLVMRSFGRPINSNLFPPIGTILLMFIGFRSAILTLRHGGITWRGTFYPLDQLRKGRVFRLW